MFSKTVLNINTTESAIMKTIKSDAVMITVYETIISEKIYVSLASMCTEIYTVFIASNHIDYNMLQ